MTTRLMFRFLLLAVVASCGVSAGVAAEWGTLTGKFVYGGNPPAPLKITPDKDTQVCAMHPLVDESLVVGPDGGIANVVVYLRTKDPAVHPDYAATASQEVPLDNKNCRFDPHVAVIRTSQPLLLKNSDPIGHNTKGDCFVNPSFNVLIPGGGSVPQKFSAEESLPVKVSCNIHPWMNGWVVVRSNPYATASAKDGSFTIKDLPAGTELEFQFWQEKSGYLKNVSFNGGKADLRGRFKLKLKPGMNDLGTIKVEPAAFAK